MYGNLDSLKDKDVIFEFQLLPESSAKPYPKDIIPKQLVEDYEEACKILHLNPKAAATLARRCLQGVIRDYWKIPKGKSGTLASEINYIRDRCDPRIMEAIDAVRKVGNIGAHMEKMQI